ncbi:MAG: hypothetical protein IPM55_10305 [Acidobacteria bacterium]|nr:hypothetical protein [Acidobacteriota bacterium]
MYAQTDSAGDHRGKTAAQSSIQVINDQPRNISSTGISASPGRKSDIGISDNQGMKSPRPKTGPRPPKRKGYIWSSHGAGWDCRRDERINGKGPRPYVGHLSKAEFDRIRSENKTPATLQKAFELWIEEKEKSKGINHERNNDQ